MTGIGTDIIEIDRISTLLTKERFCARIFTAQERDYIASRKNRAGESAAGIFCAKEAVAKALGYGIGSKLHWQDIEVLHVPSGAPTVTIRNQESLQTFLSISHCHTYATATVLILT